MTFNFWRVISHKKKHWFWKSQHVLEWQNVGPVQFSIAFNRGPTFNLYLCLYSIHVAIFARSPKDRTLGNFLEVCKNWRKTKPIRGLILHRHGLPHLIYQCLSYKQKKIRQNEGFLLNNSTFDFDSFDRFGWINPVSVGQKCEK